MEHDLRGGEESRQDIVFDDLPCRCLEDSLSEAFDICKENALRVNDLNEAGDGEPKRLRSIAQDAHRLCISNGSELFEIANRLTAKTCCFG